MVQHEKGSVGFGWNNLINSRKSNFPSFTLCMQKSIFRGAAIRRQLTPAEETAGRVSDKLQAAGPTSVVLTECRLDQWPEAINDGKQAVIELDLTGK